MKDDPGKRSRMHFSLQKKKKNYSQQKERKKQKTLPTVPNCKPSKFLTYLTLLPVWGPKVKLNETAKYGDKISCSYRHIFSVWHNFNMRKILLAIFF